MIPLNASSNTPVGCSPEICHLSGTREEKSGKFLPPPGWKGHLVTADDAPAAPRKKRA